MTRTEIVASTTAATEDELVRRGRSCSSADIVELRVDYLPSFDLERLRSLGREIAKPLLLTCRWAREGGSFSGSEEERLALLRRAIDLGFEYVDCEIAALSAPLPSRPGTKLVLSHHDLEGIPRDGDALVERALALGADVVKLAARVSSFADSLRLAELGARVRSAGKAFVPVPLGPAGTSGRILARRLGAAFTYASALEEAPTGEGQVSLDELTKLYRFGGIGDETEIYGIVGGSASSSLSPAMHNRLFARIGRDAVYVPFQETDLDRFVGAARRLGVAGLSVTLPFKRDVLRHIDELDEHARRIGAVNTVVAAGGRWKGYNTDRDGVLEPLSRLGDFRGRRAVILGAGGAARAAASALVEIGAAVLVLARKPSRAAELAEAFGGSSASMDRLPDEPWDVLVNATPMGTAGGESLPPLGAIREGAVVFDMVTLPETTALLREAREAGARTVSGLEMLAAQAVHQARLWTGLAPSTAELLGYARAKLPLERYSRQILFSEIGSAGQRRIRASSVLVVGGGALGSIASEMLVRAGVGRLRLVDRDYVDESNLQRQSLYDERDLREGLPKAAAAERKLRRINGDVEIEGRVEDVHAGNVLSLFSGMDLVLDGTDNFETRYLLNDASLRSGVPWIYAAAVGSYGMSFAILPRETPCLRCLLEEQPAPGTSPTCDTAGILASAVHAVSGFQVTEALKILAGRKDALTGAVLSLDVWQGRADAFRPSQRREDCPACGLGRLEYLEAASEGRSVTLCGRNAVQIRPSRPAAVSLEEIAARIGAVSEVSLNAYLLKARFEGRELVLFRDGRAIVHGTQDPAEARSLYARYVGS